METTSSLLDPVSLAPSNLIAIFYLSDPRLDPKLRTFKCSHLATLSSANERCQFPPKVQLSGRDQIFKINFQFYPPTSKPFFIPHSLALFYLSMDSGISPLPFCLPTEKLEWINQFLFWYFFNCFTKTNKIEVGKWHQISGEPVSMNVHHLLVTWNCIFLVNLMTNHILCFYLVFSVWLNE